MRLTITMDRGPEEEGGEPHVLADYPDYEGPSPTPGGLLSKDQFIEVFGFRCKVKHTRAVVLEGLRGPEYVGVEVCCQHNPELAKSREEAKTPAPANPMAGHDPLRKDIPVGQEPRTIAASEG